MDYITFKTRLSLHVGKKGTAREYEKYGDALLRIRYRYNEAGTLSIKTVELIEKISVIRKCHNE